MKHFRMVALSLTLLLSLTFTAQAVAGSLDNFAPVDDYAPGTFTDIAPGSTFDENVAAAYELGLMQGKSDTYFGVKDSMTRLQTLIVACRLHSAYHQQVFQTEGKTMEQAAKEYAAANGIYCGFDNLRVSANRSEVAMILTSALPEEAWTGINQVEDDSIPDVNMTADYADAVYQLYRAGVLTGNDKVGTFTPDAGITRGAMAAVATRAADVTLRKAITLTAVDETVPTGAVCDRCDATGDCVNVMVHGKEVSICQDCYAKLQTMAKAYMPYLEAQSTYYDSFALVDLNGDSYPALIAEQGASVVSYAPAMERAFEAYESYVEMRVYADTKSHEVVFLCGTEEYGQFEHYSVNAYGGFDDVAHDASFAQKDFKTRLQTVLAGKTLVETNFTIADEASLLEDLIAVTMAG